MSIEPHLADFEGFNSLELNITETKGDTSKGAEKFVLAYKALDEILKNL